MTSRLLSPPDRREVADDELEAYDRVSARFGGTDVGYFGALLQTPTICDAINDGSLAFRAAERRGTLTTEHREWIDIVVGHELGSAWLIIAHLPAAVAAGLQKHHIRAVCGGRDDELDGELRTLIGFVRAVVRGDVDDAMFEVVNAMLGPRQAVEVVAFTCWVVMNTRLAQALGQAENTSTELDVAIDRLTEPAQRKEAT